MSSQKPKPKISYKAQSFPSVDKPFECKACQLYFRRLHDLKRHERLHTGERPYCCNNCRRTFARLDALKRHLSAESNVNCSDWTYQPGLATGPIRLATRSHHRSISLPHVQELESRASLSEAQDNIGRGSTISSPKERLSYHHHYRNHSHMSEGNPQETPGSNPQEMPSHNSPDDMIEPNENTHISPPEAITEHSVQDRPHWGNNSSNRTMPMVNADRPQPSDMVVDEDTSTLDRPRPRATASFEPVQQQHSSGPHSYPQPHSLPHTFPQQPPHSHPDPHGQQPHFPPFRKPPPQQRRESYPSGSSRSTPSPASSPGLSSSPSSMSTCSMSSPTNAWPHSKGFESYDAAVPRSGPRQEGWSPSRPDPQSTQQRPSRPEPTFHGDSGSSSQNYRPHECERRPAPSLSSILNSPSCSTYSAVDQSPTLQRPTHPHHTHSQSYSHPPQHQPLHHQPPQYLVPQQNQRQHQYQQQQPQQQNSPPREYDHCCEAMMEVQKLRQELHWFTTQYRTLTERNHSSGHANGSSNSNASCSNNRERPAMSA
ncbi:MAG: hypothetical protein J3Q66DRAFT_28748 [Benniella sp.]|nr:MAG: hypothetical protein J3Q66DRAFT_28748 [Benniella sp.]